MSSQGGPSVTLMIIAGALVDCALPAYNGIARATLPLGAPVSQQERDYFDTRSDSPSDLSMFGPRWTSTPAAARLSRRCRCYRAHTHEQVYRRGERASTAMLDLVKRMLAVASGGPASHPQATLREEPF